MKYKVYYWPVSQKIMNRNDAILIYSEDEPVFAVPDDENGDYILIEWPESQNFYHLDEALLVDDGTVLIKKDKND